MNPVGIDGSKDKLDVAIAAKVEQVDNTAPALPAPIKRFQEANLTTVGLKATGGHERLAKSVTLTSL